MRDIKFRVWFDDEMLSLSEAMHKEFAVVQHNYSGGFDIEKGFEGVELMQYTGLKDKNGVEIYEGDILMLHSDKPEYNAVVSWNYECASFGCYQASDKKKVVYCDHLCGAKLVEVIGNIYQNPELIK